MKAKRDEEMEELYTYMQENQLTAEEILEYLQGMQVQEEAS